MKSSKGEEASKGLKRASRRLERASPLEGFKVT